MTDLNSFYNPNEVTVESREFDRLPDGKYQVLIEAAEIGETQSGYPRLELTYQVKGGACDGQKVWENLLLQHDNEQVVSISKSTIKKLFVATTGNPNDTNIENIKFKPFSMGIKSKPRKDDPEKMEYAFSIKLTKDQWGLMRGDQPKQSGAVAGGPATSGSTNW